ncbi:hypothetical protein HZB90_02795, partial [archaeon]|nr:hypothetical protein [archaeon]
SMLNGSLWHNYSGTWSQADYKSLSGAYAEYEFNISGFSMEKTFNWACRACDAEECDSSENRTITIDLTKPGINFTLPTPATNIRNTTFYNWLYVNTSTGDASNLSAFIDYNRSIVGWWRFENNTNDSSTSNNHATCSGTSCPETWTGARGKAYNFDGNDYIEIAAPPVTMPANSSHTMAAWFKRQDVSGRRDLIYAGWRQLDTLNNQPIAYMYNGSWQYVMGGTIYADRWHQEVSTCDEGTRNFSLYLDGVLVDSKIVSGTIGATTSYYLGGSSASAYNFTGAIDEVMMWNRALSPQEVNATYANQLYALQRNFTGLSSGRVNYTASVVDMAGNYNTTGYRNYSVNWLPNVSGMSISSSSGTNYTNENISITYSTADGDSDARKNITNWYVNGTSIAVLNMPFESNTQLNMTNWTKDYATSNHGTVNGATWNSTGGYDGRGAYELNGSSYINVQSGFTNTIKGDDTHTIVLWFKKGATPAAPVLISSSDGQYALQLGTNVFYAQTNASSYKTYSMPHSAGTWYQLAYVKNGTGNNDTLYLNGVPVTNVLGGAVTDTSNAASDLRIGYYSPGYNLNGTIDEVRIYNRTLTAQQVKALYENKTDLIVSNETRNQDHWIGCVTPNDGLEDGSQVCSEDLTMEQFTNCRYISSAGSYTLSANADGAPKIITGPPGIITACIAIASSNVDFSCNGYNITNDQTTEAAGIIINGNTGVDYTNVTIRDCPHVTGYKIGVMAWESDKDRIQNVTAHGNSMYGIAVQYTNNTNVTNSLAYNNTIAGFNIGANCDQLRVIRGQMDRDEARGRGAEHRQLRLGVG